MIVHIEGDRPAVGTLADLVGQAVTGLRPLDAFPDRLHVNIDFAAGGALDESKAPCVVPVDKYARFARHALPDSAIC
jgi:hypothetical protein